MDDISDYQRCYGGCPVHYIRESFATTPLHSAMFDRRNGLALTIHHLRNGVLPNIKNKGGETALHHAIANKQQIKVISALLHYDADVNAQNAWGNSPLHQAFIFGFNISLVNELCNAGATFRSVNSKGDTPLHVAIKNKLCNAPVLKSILKRDAVTVINARNKQGRTALIEATFRSKHTSIIKALLEHGADANICDMRGHNAMHYAISYRDLSNARLLFKYGANACSQNLECCFADEKSVFLLIQYLTLQHFEINKVSPSQNLIWDKVMVDLKHSIYFSFDELKKIYNTCFFELEGMMSDFIHYDLTVYNFIHNNLFVSRCDYREADHIIESVAIASRLSAGRYKNYLSLIFSSFKRSELLRCLSTQFILHTLPCGRDVILNADSLLTISIYLSNEDLQNLLIACFS